MRSWDFDVFICQTPYLEPEVNFYNSNNVI